MSLSKQFQSNKSCGIVGNGKAFLLVKKTMNNLQIRVSSARVLELNRTASAPIVPSIRFICLYSIHPIHLNPACSSLSMKEQVKAQKKSHCSNFRFRQFLRKYFCQSSSTPPHFSSSSSISPPTGIVPLHGVYKYIVVIRLMPHILLEAEEETRGFYFFFFFVV